MTTNFRLRILIVDARPDHCHHLMMLINQQTDMEVCGLVANGKEALLFFRQHQPDITLMDFDMPVLNGISATRWICQEFPASCIIMHVPPCTTPAEIADMYRAGAKVCLLRGAAYSHLFQTIRSLPTFITISEAADLLGITVPAVRDAVRCGDIVGGRLDGRFIVIKQSAEAYKPRESPRDGEKQDSEAEVGTGG